MDQLSSGLSVCLHCETSDSLKMAPGACQHVMLKLIGQERTEIRDVDAQQDNQDSYGIFFASRCSIDDKQLPPRTVKKGLLQCDTYLAHALLFDLLAPALPCNAYCYLVLSGS
jgi:hypothetical protein